VNPGLRDEMPATNHLSYGSVPPMTKDLISVSSQTEKNVLHIEEVLFVPEVTATMSVRVKIDLVL
jgi:hypothetical protein